jgi:hypothetical protein
MPCATVQQLPHVRRGACDWIVGGEGGRDVLVPFCDYRWQCPQFKQQIKFYFKSCKIFFSKIN